VEPRALTKRFPTPIRFLDDASHQILPRHLNRSETNPTTLPAEPADTSPQRRETTIST